MLNQHMFQSDFKYKQLLFYSQNYFECDIGMAVKPAVYHLRPFHRRVRQNQHHKHVAQQALLIKHALMTVCNIRRVLCQLHRYLFLQVDQAISAVMAE